jgi:hypothetical protein
MLMERMRYENNIKMSINKICLCDMNYTELQDQILWKYVLFFGSQYRINYLDDNENTTKTHFSQIY